MTRNFLPSFETIWPLTSINGNNSHAGGPLWLADTASQIGQNSFSAKVLGHKMHWTGQLRKAVIWTISYLHSSGIGFPQSFPRRTGTNCKNDSDYWLESERILKAAVGRLRELKPVIDMLTTPSPFDMPADSPRSEVEVELANMLEGIAEVVGEYGGPDYTSIIKNFDPIPLRQTQPFKHNKKHSAELWVVFLLREHFRNLGLGKIELGNLLPSLLMPQIFSSQTISPPHLKPLNPGGQKIGPEPTHF